MYYRKINLNKRGEMIAFLKKHFRYHEFVEPFDQLCQQHQAVQHLLTNVLLKNR